MNENKVLFEILDKDRNQKIVETHYYQWLLDKKKTDIHATLTKIEYLEEQGFKIGVNKLNETSFDTLKYIEHHYFRKVVIPTKKHIN